MDPSCRCNNTVKAWGAARFVVSRRCAEGELVDLNIIVTRSTCVEACPQSLVDDTIRLDSVHARPRKRQSEGEELFEGSKPFKSWN